MNNTNSADLVFITALFGYLAGMVGSVGVAYFKLVFGKTAYGTRLDGLTRLIGFFGMCFTIFWLQMPKIVIALATSIIALRNCTNEYAAIAWTVGICFTIGALFLHMVVRLK